VQSNLRLFDWEGSDERRPKLTLYRDHAGWCPYCQKTMLLIEEKAVPINIELVPMRSYGDKPPSFMKLVPNGLLPALGVEDPKTGQQQIVTESSVIMELLDRWHPVGEGYRAMLPPDDNAEGNARYDALARLERELFSWWCTLVFRPEGPRLGGGGGMGGLMGMLGGGGGGGGSKGQPMSGSMKGFLECLDRVDSQLTSTPGPWFFSHVTSFPSDDHPTMIDFVYVSHLERMLASCAYWKGLDLRSGPWRERYPGINAWFDAFEKRECYLAFKSDYYTHVMDIPPQYGPGYDGGFEEERREYSKAITGRDGKSWSLPLSHDDPLQPLYRGPPLPLAILTASDLTPDPSSSGTYEKCDPTSMSRTSRQFAGWKLASNGPNVSKFASRGGSKGGKNPRKGFGAPLADPYASPDVDAVPYVDAVLRIVCEAMLEDTSSDETEHLKEVLGGMEGTLRDVAPEDKRGDVISSLYYLRDRVGVPRDMPLVAARQFRAHLNWAADVIAG